MHREDKEEDTNEADKDVKDEQDDTHEADEDVEDGEKEEVRDVQEKEEKVEKGNDKEFFFFIVTSPRIHYPVWRGRPYDPGTQG